MAAFATMQYSMLEILPNSLILKVAALFDAIDGGFTDIADATSTKRNMKSPICCCCPLVKSLTLTVPNE